MSKYGQKGGREGGVKEKKGLIIIIMVVITVLVGSLVSAKERELKVESVALTDEERLLVTMAKGPTNIYKHRIFGNLPKGTQVRVWIESYHRGERVADSLIATHTIQKTAKELVPYIARVEEEVAIGFVGGDITRGALSPYGADRDHVGMGGAASGVRTLEKSQLILGHYIEGPGKQWGSLFVRGADLDEWIERSKVVHLYVVEVIPPGR